jgi:hypothetical protein
MKTKIKVILWNARFNLGWRLLPGDHKHIAIADKGEQCERCAAIYADL